MDSINSKYTHEHISERERLLNAAVAAGKFPVSRRKHYSDRFDADPAGTAAVVAGLAAIQTDPHAATVAAQLDKLGPYNERWLNDPERRRIANAQAGGRPPEMEFGV
jgi:hypothetical protein